MALTSGPTVRFLLRGWRGLCGALGVVVVMGFEVVLVVEGADFVVERVVSVGDLCLWRREKRWGILEGGKRSLAMVDDAVVRGRGVVVWMVLRRRAQAG